MQGNKLVALILAAGYSTRMGAFKPLLSIDGEYAIARCIKSLREGGINDIRVIVGHRAQDLLPIVSSLDVTPIFNDNYSLGMFSSIITGLNTFTSEVGGFLLLPGDTPLVKKTTIAKLIKKYQNGDYSVIYPTFLGKRGHPPLITRKCFGDILAQNLDSNLRIVLEKFNKESFNLPCIDQGILLDMDTPKDYQKILELAKLDQVPSQRECQGFFDLYRISEQIIRHGQKVAQIGAILGQDLNEKGLSLNLDLIRAGGLLHDIGKGCSNHAQKGGEIILSEGFPLVAEIVSQHMDLICPEINFSIDEKAIIYLADKLVKEDSIISIDKKFNNALIKYGNKEHLIKNINRRKKNAQMIEKKIKDYLNIDDLFNYLLEKIA